MVQRRAARWVTGRYHNTSSVSDMLRGLDWRSLEQRRVNSRLTILYKIRNHLVAIDENLFYREELGAKSTNIASWGQTKTTHAFPSSPGQSYNGTTELSETQNYAYWYTRFFPGTHDFCKARVPGTHVF